MAETKIVVTADTKQAERALGSLQSALAGLVSVAAITGLTQQFIQLADESINLKNKLGQITEAGQTSNQMFLLMAKSSLALGAPLKDVGDLFFRISSTTKDLAVTQAQTLRVTELLTKGFQLNGQTSAEAASASVQLGQAFGQGVLRGDELNTVLERLPAVADALSVKFGVQRGALKALGEQGKITSKDLFDAITESGTAIDKAWGQRIPTVAQSFSRLGTVIGVVTSNFDEQTGASQILSYALLIIAEAVIDLSEWMQKWGKLILYIVEALVLIYAPIRIATALLTRLGSIVQFVIGPFIALGEAIAGAGAIANGIAGTAFGSLIIYIGKAFAGLNGLFSADQRTLAEKYDEKLKGINKRLGLDAIAASNAAKEASKLKTAQMLKDADAIRKATLDRNEDLRKMLRDQETELVLTKFIGDELQIQQAIYSANKSLVRAIKNDKGETIGYTNALSAAEEKQLRLLTQQSLELKRQQDIRQKIASFSTPLSGSAAGGEAAGQLGTLAPIQAMKTANETLFAGLRYLRQNDLIDEQTYQTARLNATITAMQALATAEIQQNANKYAVMALARDDYYAKTVLGQQAVIDAAKNRAEFEKKTEFEKTSFVLDQGAQMFSALGAQNKKAFEAAKAFNIANAIMNTYMAATKALASYPPPFSFIAAAAAVGMGLAQVAQIRNQQYSGRVLGGPVMGGTSYLVGESGPELFTPQGTGSITRNGDLSGGQALNVNFTIVANDTTSFDTLLNNRKGMIKQLISDAMLDKGQRF
jgi:tape measure domain-containing protein